jgi:hypothetical protein
LLVGKGHRVWSSPHHRRNNPEHKALIANSLGSSTLSSVHSKCTTASSPSRDATEEALRPQNGHEGKGMMSKRFEQIAQATGPPQGLYYRTSAQAPPQQVLTWLKYKGAHGTMAEQTEQIGHQPNRQDRAQSNAAPPTRASRQPGKSTSSNLAKPATGHYSSPSSPSRRFSFLLSLSFSPLGSSSVRLWLHGPPS